MLGGALSSSVQCLASSGPAQEGLCGLWGSRVLSAVANSLCSGTACGGHGAHMGAATA